MGLFSRKAEDTDITVVQVPEKESVVQVIRQRFYGRLSKPKERDQLETPKVGDVPKQGSLPTPPVPPSPLSKRILPARSFESRREKTRTPLPAPDKNPPQNTVSETSSLAVPTPSKTATTSLAPPPVSVTPRKSTDAVTVTLAQRLNELATAHSDGVLSDDDYRLLRQDLFERFSGSGSTHVPSEAPIVPARPRNTQTGSSADSARASTSSRSNSNFTVDPRRPPSRTSLTSGVSSIFHRRSSRANGSTDYSETDSVASHTSKQSDSLPRRLSKALSRKPSNASVKTNSSRQTDAASIAPKSHRLSTSGDRAHERSLNSLLTKSNSSMRRPVAATPPSSFPNKFPIASSLSSTPYGNEENLKSSADVRQEIAAVEAECRRLMDAFNGLELTVLTKRNRGGLGHSVAGSERGSEDAVSTSYPRSIRRDNSDIISVHSTTSAGTSLSNARSVHSHFKGRKTVTRSRTNTSLSSTAAMHSLLPVSSNSSVHHISPHPHSTSRSNSLQRQDSQGSFRSSRSRGKSRKMPSTSQSPGTVPLPPNSGATLTIGPASRNDSTSSLGHFPPTRSSGHLPLPTPSTSGNRGGGVTGDSLETTSIRSAARGRSGSVRSGNPRLATIESGFSDDDTIVVGATLSEDLEDIKRRREDVSARYEARLDYLRAKLKTALLHEKLLKR